MTTIGHFVIVRELGRGGAGVVYLAEDKNIPGRRVALKRLQPDVAAVDAEVLRREAAALAAIEHPHILTVHEVGRHEGELYLVTELMPSGSMSDRVHRGPLPTGEALAAARQAASALAAAHDRGILHRDFKPGNLLVAADGRVKVADFGLALHTFRAEGAEQSGVSRTVTLPASAGGVFGTPLYIPPEVVEGNPVSRAADQFAFGVTLHEMLSGRRPFARERGLRDVLHAPAIDPAIPADLSRIVARCLARDPAERYATMHEVVAALDAAIARRSRDRKRLRRVLAATAAIAAVGFLGWVGLRWQAARTARRLNEEGRMALEAGSFADARRLFLASRGADASYLPACTNLGTLALLDADPSWAVAMLGDCATTFGDEAVVVYNHAAALRRAGDLGGAEVALRRAVPLARGGVLEPAVLNELTLVLTARGKPREALDLVGDRRPRAASTPESAILLKSLGLAELAAGDPGAASTLRAALSGPLPTPQRVEALVGLGRALETQADPPGAKAAYAEAISAGASGAERDQAVSGLARLQGSVVE